MHKLNFYLIHILSEESEFLPKIWVTNIASLALITNLCESCHSRFNSEFYHSHPSIFNLLLLIK
jgi:hypothetical protein